MSLQVKHFLFPFIFWYYWKINQQIERSSGTSSSRDSWRCLQGQRTLLCNRQVVLFHNRQKLTKGPQSLQGLSVWRLHISCAGTEEGVVSCFSYLHIQFVSVIVFMQQHRAHTKPSLCFVWKEPLSLLFISLKWVIQCVSLDCITHPLMVKWRHVLSLSHHSGDSCYSR